MIAVRRSDVRDLNQLAREHLRDRGKLAADELEIGGRTYATGDRVIATRNDRHAGILNGQRGTIDAIDPQRETVTVRLDHGQDVTLDSTYLAAGRLDHGYAITAHRAQGATVDRTFVLGSEDLYREWGYTALSRHRSEGRFYISRGDLGLQRDHAPEPDAIVYRLQALLGRSHAKSLAVDDLTDLDDQALAQEHAKLRERIGDDPPVPARMLRRDEEARRARRDLDDAREREQKLRERREQTPWYRRHERQQLDRLLDQHRSAVDYHDDRWQHAQAEHDHATATRHAWLDEHGPDAQRYLALDHELRLRTGAEHEAHQRLEALERGTDPIERVRELPTRELDHGLDLGP